MQKRLLELAKENLGLLILAAIIGAAFLFLRTPADDVTSEDELAALLHAGKPVLVQLFSNT
jgi:hypothetical protein